MNRFFSSFVWLSLLSFAGCASVAPSQPPAPKDHIETGSLLSPKPELPPAPAPVAAAPPPPPSVGSSAGFNKGIGGGGGGLGYGSGSGNGRGSVPPKSARASFPATGLDDTQKSMPDFKWPPPKASAREVIPDAFLRRPGVGIALFRDVDALLRSALDNCGYSESSYYAVPGGFAIATRIEQMNKNGTPKPEENRWSLKTAPINPFSDFSAYMSALFKGNPGYYRVIVFVITPNGFSQGATEPGKAEVEGWFTGGFNILPADVGRKSYTDDYRCTALIYEFKKTPQSSKPVIPGSLTGRTHLMRSGIWNNLQPKTD
ncbi:MAG: hypothetical protein FDX02_04535 [Chlorobium sp.]|nr:MAG: hypothetical protein FDX02_04535 [Chlorobium sp.]